MPISGTAEYPASHWADMLQLIQEAAKDAKFTCEIVSATGRDDIIHASIVTNIYQNEIVVCDVSSRNPNVMLELGLRLASKLPVIIIFDGEGNYPFDIGTIRYLRYRKDMRYYDINKFKNELTAKILEVQESHKKGTYKSFLSHFKNVDFDLDSIGTETQTLKEFLGSIDERLANMEQSKKNSSISNANILYKRAPRIQLAETIVDSMREFIAKNPIFAISTDKDYYTLVNHLKRTHSTLDPKNPKLKNNILETFQVLQDEDNDLPF